MRTFAIFSLAAAAICAPAGQPSKWTPIHVKGGELRMEMPQEPTGKVVPLNGQKSYFYTCDAHEGRFVAGYTPIPDGQQPQMHKEIASDPGSKGVLAILSSTVATFARGGGAKILTQDAGLDKGLPTEFATLKNDHAAMKLRVYLSSKRLYVFLAVSDPESSQRFFNSIQLPAEAR